MGFRMWRSTGFACTITIATAFFACTPSGSPDPPLIRWLDPDRIAQLESDRWNPIEDNRLLSSLDLQPFAVLDARSDWLSIYSPGELYGISPPEGAMSYEIRKTPDQEALLVGNSSGIAAWIPVVPGEQHKIFVECKAEIGPDHESQAMLLQLSSIPTWTRPCRPGGMMSDLAGTILASQPLAHVKENTSATRIVTLREETMALLLLYIVGDRPEKRIDWVKFSNLAPRHEKLMEAKVTQGLLPIVTPDVSINDIVRPAFSILPRTKVILNPIILHGNARFQCALGIQAESEFPPVRLTIVGRESSGEVHEIVRHRFTEVREHWLPLERDLSALSGRTLTFEILTEWEAAPEPWDLPPLIYCGSPVIYFEEFDRFDPGYNLILVSLDTLRRDHLGCYGYQRPVSPNLDRFAEENIRCGNVYTHSPYTLPSHASLFTALYPATHGVHSENHRLSTKTELLAEILARQGFATASFNGGGFVSHRFGFNRGFDLYCEIDPLGDRYLDGRGNSINRMPDGSTGSFQYALDWIETKKNRPFFLFLHTFMIHDYLPPQEWVDLFNADSSSLLKPERATQMMLRKVMMHEASMSDADLTYFKNMYDGTVRAVDDMMGELFAHLKDLELADRTAVVITSDHGEEFMEHGGVRHTTSVYEELIQVPLIMGIPGMTGGVVIDSSLNQVDLMPTLLEILKVDYDGPMQGRSFAGLLSGDEQKDRPIYAEVDLVDRTRRCCLIQDGWKYVEGVTDPEYRYPAPAEKQLFHLVEDPAEQKDLNSLHDEIQENLKKTMYLLKGNLKKAREELGVEEMNTPLDREMREVLRQQGYL
ncbi:MAG: sulfatase-like hydrolase/transferase [Planctomycetes bacterium]|nr:sulfatase-like hydrolase/transferase [Planctomycetota bacterium]